jgi:hypothetical protein
MQRNETKHKNIKPKNQSRKRPKYFQMNILKIFACTKSTVKITTVMITAITMPI